MTDAHVHFPPAAPNIDTKFASTSSSDAPTNARPAMADGRRNSQGEVLVSPIEDWKPDFKRRQSFRWEELKRAVYGAEIKVEKEIEDLRGFTEGGAGTRKV